MLSELDSYTLMSFTPMEPEVYRRLFVRHNQMIWPAQPFTLGLGLVALAAAWQGRGGVAGLLLGACWIWVGWSFQLRLHAELNWAASYAGWAFIAQGVLLGLWGARGRLTAGAGRSGGVPRWAGLALTAYAVALHPLLGPLTGRDWTGSELLGSTPDPTALATLGMLLLAHRPAILPALVPLLWCLYSAATWWAMDWPPGLVSAAGAVVFMLAFGGARTRTQPR